MSRCAFSGLALSISSLPISPTRRPKRWKIETNLAPLADYKHGKRNLENRSLTFPITFRAAYLSPRPSPLSVHGGRLGTVSFPCKRNPSPEGRGWITVIRSRSFHTGSRERLCFPGKFSVTLLPLSGQVETRERERIGEEEASSGRAWEERRNLRSRFSRREEGRSLGYTRERRSVNGNSRKRVEGTVREREREKRSKGGSLGQTQCFPLFLCHPPSDSLPRATFILSLSLSPRPVTLSCVRSPSLSPGTHGPMRVHTGCLAAAEHARTHANTR